jgi:hypothetical protein
LDVLEPSGLEPLQMVSVTMGRDDQIKPLFARYIRIGKLALEMLDCLPQEIDATQVPAIDQDMEPTMSIRDPNIDAITKTDVVSTD